MAAAFESESELIAIGNGTALVLFSRAFREAIGEPPEHLTEQMRDLLRQLESVTLK